MRLFKGAVKKDDTLRGPGSCPHEPENGMYTMMVREDTNHGLEHLYLNFVPADINNGDVGVYHKNHGIV